MLCRALAYCLKQPETVKEVRPATSNNPDVANQASSVALPFNKISCGSFSLPITMKELQRQDTDRATDSTHSTETDRAANHASHMKNPLKSQADLPMPPVLNGLPSEAAAYAAATAAYVSAAKAAEAAAAAKTSASAVQRAKSPLPSARGAAHAAARAARLAGVRAQNAALQVPPIVRNAVRTRAASPSSRKQPIERDEMSTPSYMASKTSIRTLRRGTPEALSRQTSDEVSQRELDSARRVDEYRMRWAEKWAQ